MIYVYVRIASLLNVVLSFTVIFMQLIKYDDHSVSDFLNTPEICEGGCLLGIRPGRTTLGEALEYLQSDKWIESVQLNASGRGYGQIRWLWSGEQPALIDASYPGRITFNWDREEPNAPELHNVKIQTIAIATVIRMDLLRSRYGTPDSGTATIRADGRSLGYAAAYHVQGSTISLSTILPCPVNLMSYWNAATKITMSIGQGTSEYVSPVEMVKIC